MRKYILQILHLNVYLLIKIETLIVKTTVVNF